MHDCVGSYVCVSVFLFSAFQCLSICASADRSHHRVYRRMYKYYKVPLSQLMSSVSLCEEWISFYSLILSSVGTMYFKTFLHIFLMVSCGRAAVRPKYTWSLKWTAGSLKYRKSFLIIGEGCNSELLLPIWGPLSTDCIGPQQMTDGSGLLL